MLQLTIPGGIDPPSTLTDGNAALVDLSSFPRLRLAGDNTLDVSMHVHVHVYTIERVTLASIEFSEMALSWYWLSLNLVI